MLGMILRCLLFAALLSHFLSDIVICQDAVKPKEQPKASSTPIEPWPSMPLGLDPVHVIDLALEHGYREHSVYPSKSIDDASFARRLYLDLIGRVPKPTEVLDFLTLTESTKRAALIDQLLASVEHAEHLAEVAASPCVVKSIAYKKNITVLNITSTRMLLAHGFMASIFDVFRKRTGAGLRAARLQRQDVGLLHFYSHSKAPRRSK